MSDGEPKIGRPPFVPSKAQRKRVAIVAGAGMSHEHIALALGISRPTLYKYFEEELTVGAYKCLCEVSEAMFREAKKGNTAAAKVYAQLAPKLAAAPDLTAPELPEGKKAQQKADAITAQAGTSWETLLKPISVQ